VIYFDYNATTPVLPEVFEAMQPYFCAEWGNPSSAYRFGSKNKRHIEEAREKVANLIGAQPNEILFTSCATESNNAAISAALKSRPAKRHIITSGVEHSSVLNYCHELEKNGYRVTYLPVDHLGLLSLADFENAIDDYTGAVSLLWANNETGVIFPVYEIAQICADRDILFHCDGVQAVGKLELDVGKLPIDFLSLSGHKFFGPKGIGALYIRQSTAFSPFIFGGHQENGRRGGTENLPLIVGLGKAAELAKSRILDFDKHIRNLRDQFETSVLSSIPNTEINGDREQRLGNTSNIAFHGVESDALLALLDQAGICASKGSACLGNSDGPSHVVKAMKPMGVISRQSLRFSLGFKTSDEDIKNCIVALVRNVATLRS